MKTWKNKSNEELFFFSFVVKGRKMLVSIISTAGDCHKNSRLTPVMKKTTDSSGSILVSLSWAPGLVHVLLRHINQWPVQQWEDIWWNDDFWMISEYLVHCIKWNKIKVNHVIKEILELYYKCIYLVWLLYPGQGESGAYPRNSGHEAETHPAWEIIDVQFP